MAIRNLTRNVSALVMRADVSSVDEKARTAEMTFSTGARVLRQSYWDGPSYEELGMAPENVRMGRLQSGAAPLLADHRASVDNVIGVVTSARLEGGKGVATVRFPAAGVDERADQIFAKVKDGIVRSVSVGYRTYKTEKVGVEGDAKVPVFRATDWEPYEVSCVALPADADAGFRSAEPLQCNPCVFVTREEESNTVNEEERKKFEAEAKAKAAAEQARIAEIEKREAAVRDSEQRAAKVERENGIRHATRVAKLGDEFAAQLIGDVNLTLDGARARVLDELAKKSDETAVQSQRGTVEVGEEAREKWQRGATAGILVRSGVMPLIAATVAGVKDGSVRIPGVRHEFKAFDADDDGGEFRGLSLSDLARESLEIRGVNTRRMNVDAMVSKALTYRDGGGDATISDFAVLLENVMYKTLLGAYTQAADTWRRFCGTDSVQDFRPSNRYRTGSFGVLDLKGESGEYKHKAIPDGLKFAITTQTYGNKIAVSREAIINDDMGAIIDTMSKFGRAAGLTIEKAVFDLISTAAGLGPNVTLGGVTAALFDDTAWKNVSTGAALSMAALEADRVKMAQQKDISNNEYLDLRPSVLLVPLGLEGLANQINRAKFDPTSAAAFEAPNIVGGLFRDVVGTPRLTGTRRYLFTDSNDAAAIKVVFLNGAQTPFMDQRLGWNVDGTEMKLRMDMKVQAFDPKGALTNAGT